MAGPGTHFTGPVISGPSLYPNGTTPADAGLAVLSQVATLVVNGTNAVTAQFALPYGSQIVDILADTTTAWNSGTSDVLSVATRTGGPPQPTLSSVAGGTLAATTYYAVITYVTASGETLASGESSLAVALDNLLVVDSPPAYTGATGYNVYVSTSSGTETKQNSSPISIGTNWTEPTTGLVAGTSPPVPDYASGISVATAGRVRPTYTATQLENMLNIAGNTAVYATVTPAGTAATTGSTTVTLLYVQTVQLTAGTA